MPQVLSTLTGLLLKVGLIALLLNEVRGVLLAGPVLYALYRTGGTGMALRLGLCALAGIAISVVAPLFIARKLRLLPFELSDLA